MKMMLMQYDEYLKVSHESVKEIWQTLQGINSVNMSEQPSEPDYDELPRNAA